MNVEQNKITGDGSVTFFNSEFKEHYHSIDGAREEALAKYITPSKIKQRLAGGVVSILDICFGLGYNTLLAAEESFICDGRLSVTALEIDKNVVDKASKCIGDTNNHFEWRKILSSIYNDSSYVDGCVDINMIWGDARVSCVELIAVGMQYDLIYHDPFSTQRNSQLWSVDFFKKLYKLLNYDGVVLTYSMAIPVIVGLIEAGFFIGKSISVGSQRSGTVAAKRIDALQNPYSEDEIKAFIALPKAIPYRDVSSEGSNSEILKERNDRIITQRCRAPLYGK